jgi:enoyl-[acyl-carrier protein] reductase III
MSTTLVIGGSGGIGAALVRKYARNGDDVVFTYLKAEEVAKALVKECSEFPGSATCLQADSRDDEATRTALALCDHDLHTVVFSAASAVNRPLAAARGRHWDWTFDVNVRGFALLFRDALPALAETKGSLIALTSLGSRRVIPRYAIVGACKAAIDTTVRYAAVEAGPHGVRVNSVCPGVVDTKALHAFPDFRRAVEDAAAKTPLGRLVTPSEVADVVFWLASEEASMITGQSIVIDGGWELHGPLVEDAERRALVDA